MWLIIILVVVGVLLLVAELVLLPGLSVAGICAVISYGGAVYLGFDRYGTTGGIIVIGAIAVLTVIAVILSLRARTWQKLALHQQIDGTSQELPSARLSVGDRGIATTRLAPSGKVIINDETYEARTFSNEYLDPRSKVEVADFENFTVIVRPVREENEQK